MVDEWNFDRDDNRCQERGKSSFVAASYIPNRIMKMHEAGLNVTINTDDPSISRITLSHEYYTACAELNMPLNTLKERIIAAAQAGFLPAIEKEKLVFQLKNELKM